VSNPVTRKDLAARTWGVFWYSSKCPVLFETMVQIKQKRGHGVETPHPRRFWCGIQTFADVSLRRIVVSEVRQMYSNPTDYVESLSNVFTHLRTRMYLHTFAQVSFGHVVVSEVRQICVRVETAPHKRPTDYSGLIFE